jgi:hypothetical protein
MIDLLAAKTLMYDPVDFAGMLQETGTIDDKPKKPELPADVWIEEPIDPNRVHDATHDLCRGF